MAKWIVIAWLILVCALNGLLMPTIVKTLKKSWKVHLILQQLCVITFLVMSLISLNLYGKVKENIAFEDVVDYVEGISMIHEFLKEVCHFFKMYTYYFFCTVEMIHVANIKKMICEPFEYARYVKMKNEVKPMLAAGLLSLHLGMDQLTKVYFHESQLLSHNNEDKFLDEVRRFKSNYPGMNQKFATIEYVNIGKLAIFKLVSCILFMRFALLIHRSWMESRQLVANSLAGSKTKSLFILSLIPIGNCCLFLMHDAPLVVLNLFSAKALSFDSKGQIDNCEFGEFISMVLSSVGFTLGLLSYFICYLISFPKFRRGIYCCKTAED